jgi:SAM-dependent methyltransferase
MCGATTQIQQIATQDYAYAMNDDIFVYSQCATCMSWTQQMPPLNIADFYPSTYGNPNQKRRKLMHLTKSRKHRVLIRKLKTISTGSRLLDFGCGDAQFLMDCGDRKLELFGTDFDERRKPDVEKTGGVWIPHNELFHYSNNFDVVALFQVLEHLPNPRETLSLLRKCLVDGGLMVIETPSPSGLDYHCFATTYWGGFHAPRHFFIPSTSSMRELVEGIGFEVLEHRYIPSPYTWAETLKVAVSKFLPPRLVCRFFTLDNPFFLIPIAILEYATLWFGGSTSNQRLIARARPTSSR